MTCGPQQGPDSGSANIFHLSSCGAQPGDVNGDGVVYVNDLLAVINGWGPCLAKSGTCAPDLNADGIVNAADLLIVLNNWG